MTARELRDRFLAFFASAGHRLMPPAPLRFEDPTVLFTTAGVQQFRRFYTEPEAAPAPRIATCQPCFRTSDIEEVGDDRHLTFFEMLGNFSFGYTPERLKAGGAYFKEEAIKHANDFLFTLLDIPKEGVEITVFGGDDEIPRDEDSARIWQDLGWPAEKIRDGSREDNFWGPIGDAGPCGPTTEIHIKGLEVWNLVFNEYWCDRGTKTLKPLDYKGVDTGMGLERLALVVEEKNLVFETDLFAPLIEVTRDLPERSARILADHAKGITFLAAEGLHPSNKEHGYILRRLIRRSMVHEQLAGRQPGKLIPTLAARVIELYKDTYAHLRQRQIEIHEIIETEAIKFTLTLVRGLREFDKAAARTAKKIEGETAFHLFDTYGFPIELTVELAAARGLEVDRVGFEARFRQHQKLSRRR